MRPELPTSEGAAMLRRLLEVCEALANADEAGTLPLWRQLTGGLLEDACRASLFEVASARPALARCVDLLAGEDLIGRVGRFIGEVARYESDEAEWLVADARREILGAIVAGLALRCSAGEATGAELLRWASRLCLYHGPGVDDLVPADPARPVCWVEACLQPLFR